MSDLNNITTTTEAECRWEAGDLGSSLDHAVPVSRGHASAVDDSLGMQMISIRLPKSLIEDLKYFAEREGLGYQPLMRKVLLRYASHEYKNLAREEFSTQQAAPQAVAEEYQEPMRACR
jgi:hypothetical protein